jgi:transcription factor IIIB subunit 2
MLLDVAEVLNMDVFKLGGVFLTIVNRLRLTNIPIVDPSVYIPRFSSSMAGAQWKQVSMVALRLVGRMKRDWIQYGRRPAGICGACILIACRMLGINVTVQEAARTVRMCDVTIKKRLTEFSLTPSSRLTWEEFKEVDLEEECDPPAFTRARESDLNPRKAKKRKIKEVTKDPPPLPESEVAQDQQMEKEINSILESSDFVQVTQSFNLDLDASISDDVEPESISGHNGEKFSSTKEVPADVNVPVLVNDDEATGKAHLNSASEEDSEEEAEEESLGEDLEDYSKFILTEEESQKKLQEWEEMHADYLKERETRSLTQAVVQSGLPRRQRGRVAIVGRSAADSTAQALEATNRASKLNPSALAQLLASRGNQ